MEGQNIAAKYIFYPIYLKEYEKSYSPIILPSNTPAT
jgi:hypothetical protein